MQFNIDEDGNVSKALVIERTLRNPRLDKCLTERIRRWRLPPPEGGSVIVSQSYHVGRWW